MRVAKPIFSVLYNSKNITADISNYMLSITYADKTEGESDGNRA
jgi:phage protein D